MNKKTALALTVGTLLCTRLAYAADAGNSQALPAACGKPPTVEQLAKIDHKARELSRAEVDALLADSAHVVFIDMRRPDEITTCGGFPVFLSIQAKDLEAGLPFIPHDRRIVTVSNHAVRAWRSADLLAARGFDVVGAVSAENYASNGGTALTRITPPQRQAGADTSANGTAALAAAPAAR